MTAIITLQIQAPINCSEDEFTEWIRFELYERANIKASNPLVHENFTSIINSIEIK
jgi:hypothetical protein